MRQDRIDMFGGSHGRQPRYRGATREEGPACGLNGALSAASMHDQPVPATMHLHPHRRARATVLVPRTVDARGRKEGDERID